MTGQDMVDQVLTYLTDEDGDVWSETLVLSFINDAVGTIAMLRPDATATTDDVTIVADSARQSLPSDAARLLSINRNTTSGKPVRKIAREVLAELGATWTAQSVSDIEHYMYDDENPLVFHVHPVLDSAGSVEMAYSAVPETITLVSDLRVSSVYNGPIFDYVLHRCFGMETERIDRQKSVTHLNAFYNALGVKIQNEARLKLIQEV